MELVGFKKEDFGGLFGFMKPLWEETYTGIIPQAQITLLLHKYFDKENVDEFLKKGYAYFNAVENGVICGVVVVWEKEDENYLDKLYLLPEYRGKGLATEIFDLIMGNGKPIVLNVNQKNARAIACYEKNGFEVLEEERIELGDGMVNVDYKMIKRPDEKKFTNSLLFERQKETLDLFLEKGCISRAQYDKSLSCLIAKMKK